MSEHRPISEIAAEIRKYWEKPNYAAKPYLDAMRELDSIHGKYYEDSAESVVAYFLCNATTWRGEHARRIKAELKSLLKTAR